jgi:hypothetical protein
VVTKTTARLCVKFHYAPKELEVPRTDLNRISALLKAVREIEASTNRQIVPASLCSVLQGSLAAAKDLVRKLEIKGVAKDGLKMRLKMAFYESEKIKKLSGQLRVITSDLVLTLELSSMYALHCNDLL